MGVPIPEHIPFNLDNVIPDPSKLSQNQVQLGEFIAWVLSFATALPLIGAMHVPDFGQERLPCSSCHASMGVAFCPCVASQLCEILDLVRGCTLLKAGYDGHLTGRLAVQGTPPGWSSC